MPVFNLIWFIFLAVLAGAIGLKILRRLELGKSFLTEKAVFSLSLGLVFYSSLIFILGMAGLLYRGLVYFIVFCLFIIFIPEMAAIFKKIKKIPIKIWIGKLFCNKENFLCLSVLAIFAAVSFIEAFAPVYNWDSLAYHMAAPKLYLKAHRIYFIPFMIASNWPSAIDMLFLLGLAVNSDILSQLFSWSLTIIFLFSIYAFCRRYLSAREGKLSTMIMCGVPLVVFYAAITYVDLGASLFVFLGIYAFMNWLNSRCKAWLFLSAATCGFSAGTKLSCALIPPLLLIAVAAGGLLSKQRPKKIALDLLQVSIICALFAAPWYIKAWISTGNPTYPFLYSFFGGKYWNIFSDSVYMKLTDSARVKSIKDLLSLPWRWTFGAFDASIGALLPVGLAIVLLRLKKMPRSLRPVLFISFLLLVSFALFTNQPRFYFAVFACWSIAIACEFNRTWPTGRLTGFLLAAFLFLLSFCWNLDTKRHKLSAALGLSPREEFLARSIPFYRQFQWMNNNLGFDCRILIWSGHPYSLDKDYVEVIPIQGLIDFSRIKDGPGLLERMRELGVTHLFYAPRERTTYPVVGGLLDFLHDDLVKTGRLVLVKKWTFAEILNNSQVVDTMLYRVSY